MADMTDFERMERGGWSNPSIAKGYADGFDYASRYVARHLADLTIAAPGRNILDLCTGHGVVAAELVGRGATVTGLDFSAAMISLARDLIQNAHFVQGDAMAMPFTDQSFDAVTIGFGVPHFSDPARALAEVARVLQPGGKLAFSIWHGNGSNGGFGWLFSAVERLGDPTVSLPEGPDAHMFATAEHAQPMVVNTGFCEFQLVEMASELLVKEPSDLFDVFDQGAVRAASLLGNQSQTRREAIRADLAQRVRAEGKQHADGYTVPVPSVAISATRL